ncbi:MAG: hypothetical protein DRJ65_05020 [Acidobacteria bacterium]|nr:MAG: hypothetical protein DRJ65_05020 [Acidobacteriota bacterium]
MALRILWASPLPPVRSGVSDYAVELLRPLSGLADVRILTPPGSEGQQELAPDLASLLVPLETTGNPGEIFVAHFGNNPYHRWILEQCRGRRTVAVVHDLVLHHLLVHQFLDVGKDPDAFAAAMGEAHGDSGEALAQARTFGLSGRLDPFLFPALKALLGDCEALICHSEFGRRELLKVFPGTPVLRMKLPVADPGPVDRVKIREKLGISDQEILMMHLGFLTPEKGLAPILGGLAAARGLGINARLLLVGEKAKGVELQAVAETLGLGRAVMSTGWLPWDEMVKAPAAADVGVVLRVPSAGETSAAVVRFLACGTPAAVIARRQFLEWPEEVAPRITPGPSTTAEIARLLSRISKDGDWKARRPAARKFYEDGHTPEQAAKAMVEFLRSLS